MAVSLSNLRRARSNKPPRIVIYGPHGVGKTNLAAGAPSTVFIQTEDGIADPRLADVFTFGTLRSYNEVFDAITSLYTEDHDFKTVAVDTLDHLEPLVWAEACKRNGWANIEVPGFGKGYGAALDVWRELFAGFDGLRDDKNMGVIFLAHAAVKKFESPETEPYDRYRIKLHESGSGQGAAPLIQEHVDCVFFLNYRVSILKAGKGDQAVARGAGSGQRVVYTAERPAYLAKNRYSMPAEISLPNDPDAAWDAVAKHIPFYSNQPAADAA